VDEEDMRIAIGSKGRNARLTSKLMGWGLNIAKATHAPESARGPGSGRTATAHGRTASVCRSTSSPSSSGSA
jgi:transcription antitermination factor NusA-like protein